uniref:Uncharacterized protein n=1 Tax=Arundo donax TaxID=35708 RepID=A0A0A9CJZ1_ARUDO
MVTSVIIWVV